MDKGSLWKDVGGNGRMVGRSKGTFNASLVEVECPLSPFPSAQGAQTERPGDAGPVMALLGG
jgi:hypothetical protein